MNNDINKLIEENKGLITFVLNNFYPAYRNDEDFYQEGLIGLWNACKSYDETQNKKFSTFATRCIRNHLNGVLYSMNAEKRKLNNMDNVISLNQNINDSEDTIINHIEDNGTEISTLAMREYVDTQNLRNKKIIAMKSMGYDTKKIAESLNISGQTVRRIWNKLRSEVIECL